jgi:IS30 family transposase
LTRTYRHLDLGDRRALFRLVEARTPVGEIAARLGRHPSTIYRELGRDRFRDGDRGFCGYFPLTAQDLARRRRQRRRKPAADDDLREHVVERLKAGWSPQRIAGRLEREADGGTAVCHETIYRHVYGPEGRRGRPPPPPAQGAPAARQPLRPKAPQHPDPARALDREPAGGGRGPGELRPLGSGPADLPQGGRQGQRDLAHRA